MGVGVARRVRIHSTATVEDGVRIGDGTTIGEQCIIRRGATIGANCTIENGLIVGRFAMIGMGSVVTKSVRDFHFVVGDPAQPVGYVCRCGQLLENVFGCTSCNARYYVRDGTIVEGGNA